MINDLSRHVATNTDIDYSLSIEEALNYGDGVDGARTGINVP